MNAKELAERLNGTEEVTKQDEADAKKYGLVIVYGASDDLIEFSGAIHDEGGCCDGGEVFLTRKGVLEYHECDCDFCGYNDQKNKALKIDAVWCAEGEPTWTYKTSIPHATFIVKEDSEGRDYCRGMVFQLSDMPI